MKIIYIFPKEYTNAEKDPFISLLEGYALNKIAVYPETPLYELQDKLLSQIEKIGHVEVILIVLNAFLAPNQEDVRPNLVWDPSDEKLFEMLDLESKKNHKKNSICHLKSLELLWALWKKIPRNVELLVTTNRIRLSDHAAFALYTAFSYGRVCTIYNWDDDSLMRALASKYNIKEHYNNILI